MKHLLYLIPCLSIVVGCFVDSSDFEPELQPMMYLEINDEKQDLKLYGNEASSVNRFLAGVKVTDKETRYISECISLEQAIGLKLRIVKLPISTRREGPASQPLESRTYYNSEILNNLQYELLYTDKNGVKWYSGGKREYSLTNILTIEEIEPYSSILDGKKLQLITFSFEVDMINEAGQIRAISGRSRSIIEEIHL